MPNDSAISPWSRLRRLFPFFGAAAVLAAFHLSGTVFLDGFALDLGSVVLPTPKYLYFVLVWIPFGTVAALLISIGVAQAGFPEARLRGIRRKWDAISDRQFQILSGLIALLIPLMLRALWMGGSPLTDDESAYRFAAELLATGRLWVPSPPLKMFFDQNFIINDGRMYPAYFLGWPALLAPAVRVGIPWIANPLYSALTVPLLFSIIRRFSGAKWARAGVLLFLSSPFVQVAAATGLSHTSCLLALTCSLFMYLRTREPTATAGDHAGFATAFSAAFWIRPHSALALGVPLLVCWALDSWRREGDRRWSALFSFLAPSGAFAGLFLLVLWLQNGSPWSTGYARYVQYVTDNGFLFTTRRPEHLTLLPGFIFGHPLSAAVRTGLGLFRLNLDLFGWPSSFILAGLAVPGIPRNARILLAMVACYVAVFFFQKDWGIDSFGPVHAFELTLPVLVLTIIGARTLQTKLERPVLAPGLLIGLIVSAQVGFVPVRLRALRQITTHVAKALKAPEQVGAHNAVIFAPFPFAPPCGNVPRHFVLFRPVNDPDLRRDILWVNNVSSEENSLLLDVFEGRQGYVMEWSRDCDVELLPVSEDSPTEETGTPPIRHDTVDAEPLAAHRIQSSFPGSSRPLPTVSAEGSSSHSCGPGPV